MITIVNQVSSVWFDNKLWRKSLHNEKNFNKCEFTAENSVNSSISLLILCKIADKNRQNFVGFDCRSFPLGLNTLDTDAPYSTDINTYGLYIYIKKNTCIRLIIRYLLVPSVTVFSFSLSYNPRALAFYFVWLSETSFLTKS